MATTSKSLPQLRYHRNAYRFVFAALRHVQQKMQRDRGPIRNEEDAHITGQELLEGVRELALQQFGLLTNTVFRNWGITCTDDFGRMVFEMVERGEMRKTERDSLEDFVAVYSFDDAFDRNYRIDTRPAFERPKA